MRKLILKWLGLSIMTQAELQAFRRSALINGKEIGRLEVLRYNRHTLSEAKFKESAIEFDYQALDKKYPFNPLLEKSYEKSKAAPESF